jgi:hypothetical protein
MVKGAVGENISILQERENAIFIWRGRRDMVSEQNI